MKIVLLGTAGYHPNDHRQTAGAMMPEIGVLMDAGTATYRVRDYLKTRRLDIFLSHAHLDHVIGLTYLFDVMHETPLKHVVVHGTPETLRAVDTHLFAEALFPARPAMDFQPLHGTTTLADGGRLSWFPVPHPGGAVGYRIDWTDRSMAYVTDTTAASGEPYLDRIRGVDLLIHECFFDDDGAEDARRTGHSYARCVAEIAKAAGVQRLVLVHFNPLMDETEPIRMGRVRSIFPAAEIGRDRLEIEI